jgi:hypothetical protein
LRAVIVALVRFSMDPSIPADDVRSSFRASAPNYASTAGLVRKHFLYAADRGEGGGVYVWESRVAADAFYDDAWFARMTAKFGAAPTVDLFENVATVAGDARAVTGDAAEDIGAAAR